MICKDIFGEAFRWNSPEEITRVLPTTRLSLKQMRSARSSIRPALVSVSALTWIIINNNQYSEDFKPLASGLDSYISGTVEV